MFVDNWPVKVVEGSAVSKQEREEIEPELLFGELEARVEETRHKVKSKNFLPKENSVK